jgi:hypothetical protein
LHQVTLTPPPHISNHPRTTLKARPIIIPPILHPRQPPQRILRPHDPPRHSLPNAHKGEKRPFPPERVNRDAEHKPPDQLQVREEIKCRRRRSRFQEACHVDPALHPEGPGAREGVHEEHQEDARVDADVPVTDCADGVDVGAVYG